MALDLDDVGIVAGIEAVKSTANVVVGMTLTMLVSEALPQGRPRRAALLVLGGVALGVLAYARRVESEAL